jgi:putative protease
MITENCLIRNGAGCDCGQAYGLRDRTGTVFPLLPAFGHRTEVENGKPLYLADRQDRKHLGLTYARLRFTTETAADCVRVFRAYQSGGTRPADFTRGLFDRGVD